jgi:gamma-glutamylcyclotransferase (GGCT)/AIG2-like uncharacterized protein YtfP
VVDSDLDLVNNRLFVYGSLRRMGGAFERLLADAVIAVRDGVLADHALFGWGLPYPFVRPETGHRVVGDVVEIDPERVEEVLKAVDEYEGSDYRRVEIDVDTDRETVTAFVYLADSSIELEERNRVESGDWMMPI